MTNVGLAQKVIESLLQVGVREFCLCAGARNSPLVFLFDKNPQLRVYNFFEERSAASFALGRIASKGAPVAVITTSGTAAAELLPATIEAHYSSLPLILVTADRPKSFRGRGAPQSIEQIGLFSHYVEQSFDLDSESNEFSNSHLVGKTRPIHVNVCFSEPLIDAEIPVVERASQISYGDETPKFKSLPLVPGPVAAVKDFLQSKRPLVVVSNISAEGEEATCNFLRQSQLPCILEATSNLRGHPDLKNIEFFASEKAAERIFKNGICDSIIRLGGVPTLRFWRALEDKWSQLPVLSISDDQFTGLSRKSLHLSNLSDGLQLLGGFSGTLKSNIKTTELEAVYACDRKFWSDSQQLMKKYPMAEPSLFYALSKHIKGANLYLGNSLPIREWDSFSERATRPNQVFANRGANGIDGQVSSFFGSCSNQRDNWGIFGDLTTMYDLSAPWIVPQLESCKYRLVIINNRGGQIFDRMFKKDIFLNRHQVDFLAWAKMWNLNYQCWDEVPESSIFADQQVIEVQPSLEQTQLFWQELDQYGGKL